MVSFRHHIKISTAACTCALLLAFACTNEPFTLLPLGISAVENTTLSVNSYYYYKNQRVRNFWRTHGADTLANWKFHYSNEGLERIVMDSTADGYSELRITGSTRRPVVDTLVVISGDVETLQLTRKFSYDSDRKISRIEVIAPGGSVQAIYDLKWTGDNITELKKSTVSSGTTSETKLAITHDGKTGIYSSDAAYLFTIPLDEIYWISRNNPIAFKRDTLKQVSYIYFYNSRGYPSHIRTDKGQVIGHTYTELR